MDGARIPFTPEDERKIASAATWGSIVAIASVVGSSDSNSIIRSDVFLRSASRGSSEFTAIAWSKASR